MVETPQQIERIIGVAVIHEEITYRLPRPKHHTDIMRDLVLRFPNHRLPLKAVKLFETDQGRLITAEQALHVAIEAKQYSLENKKPVQRKVYHFGRAVTSKDLW